MADGRGELQVLDDPDQVRSAVRAARRQGKRVGCVPTMGALHEGHLSLIRAARAECDFVVVTIFVNPTQFGPNEDFDKYPRPLEADLAACRKEGVDVVFHPAVEAMYPAGSKTFVEVEGLSTIWEGACRPGHFRGVATIVTKLLNVTEPDVAYFGQKDYQQQLLIRQMCRDLLLPVRIRVCPTVREPDGLAMSSRNAYLSPEERRSALALSQALFLARDRLAQGERDLPAIRQAMRDHLESQPNVRVDYVTICHPETLEELEEPLPRMVALVAARVNETRLIDNLLLET
ncbi:MAG: pantoate--beta-alanine ligase [Planctomycetes bacterium]|nr:pantoate--beta-alanine ligase [Planctomycetota bacterium]